MINPSILRVVLLGGGTLTGATLAPIDLRSLSGPVEAEVVEVVDGDTLAVRAHVWIGQTVETKVRLAGVDAPELRARCPREREMAERARRLLGDSVAGGRVVLIDVHHGKFAGRVVATVRTADGRDLARLLVGAGLARAYAGGRREPWCEAA